MLSRALSLATVTLLIGCFAASPVRAQNLEAGKSPSQIFAGTCTACHKSPRGLLEDRAGRIAAGFPAPALHHQQRHGLAAQRLSDLQRRDRYARSGASRRKQAKDAKPDGQPAATRPFGRPTTPGAGAQEAARPEAEPQAGRDRRPAPTAATSSGRAEADASGAQAAAESRQGRRRQGRAGQGAKRPKDDAPKSETPGEGPNELPRKPKANSKDRPRRKRPRKPRSRGTPKPGHPPRRPSLTSSRTIRDRCAEGERRKRRRCGPIRCPRSRPRRSDVSRRLQRHGGAATAPAPPAAAPAPPPAVTASGPPLPPVPPPDRRRRRSPNSFRNTALATRGRT